MEGGKAFRQEADMQSIARGDEVGTPVEEPDDSVVARVLEEHGGDARAAISTLLADCGYLRGQLALATGMMGYGFSRGWVPASCRRPDQDDAPHATGKAAGS
jgi:hypothetical protein